MSRWRRLPRWSTICHPGNQRKATKRRRRAAMKNKPGLVLAGLLLLATQTSFAKDDFGTIVQHIEAQYHVHRQHRFVMGMAGFVLKFYHFAGVKSLKGAIFENQPFLDAGADNRLDEIIRDATNSGWQTM